MRLKKYAGYRIYTPVEEPAANPCVLNTDVQLWTEDAADPFAPTIFLTERGGIGIHVGGRVFVKSVREWHQLAMAADETPNDR